MRIAVSMCLCLVVASGARAQEPLGEVPPPPTEAGPAQARSPMAPQSTVPPAPPPPAHGYAPQPPQAAPPLQPVQPTRPQGVRSTLEIAELYVGASAFATLAAATGLVATGTEDPSLHFLLPVLAVGGSIGTVLVLDSGEGMPAGVPTSITSGMVVGLLDGLLLWPALGRDWGAGTVLGVLTTATAAGALAGGAIGYGLRPTVADSRLLLTLTAWGGWLSALGALIADADGVASVFRVALVGANVGAALGLVLSSLTDVSMERVAMMNGAAAAGTLTAFLVLLALANKVDFSPAGLGTGLLIGGGLGLLVGALVKTDGDDGGATSSRLPAIMATPVPGGAMVGASWQL